MIGMTDPAVVGCVGDVRLRIAGGDHPGEVAVRVRGTTEVLIAYSDEPLERGETVLVVASRGNLAVDVIPWTE